MTIDERNDDTDPRPVQFGVVGCGVIGTRHLESLAETGRATAVAVADIRVEAAEEARDRFGVDTVYDDPELLFADKRVEAVVLALPTTWRFDLAMVAFGQGKHVLIEKPIAMDAVQVERLIEARGDLVAGCCSARYRLLPSAKVATEVVESGVLGPIRMVRSRGLRKAPGPPEKPPPPWRLNRSLNGGGILVNWGSYDLDYVLGVTGWTLRPESVMAQTWPIPGPLRSYVPPESDAETHVTALVRCRDGAILSFERGEYVAAESENAWQINGERATLQLQMLTGRDKRLELDELTETGVSRRTIWTGDESGAQVHLGVIDDFADAVRERRSPATSLENALTVQRITDAIYASARDAAVAVIP